MKKRTDKKQLKYLFFLCFLSCFLLSSSITMAYDLPIGIPDPSGYFNGINPLEISPPFVDSNGNSEKCPNWPSSENPGCYYVDKNDPEATDSSNQYGYPNKPRKTLPEGRLEEGSFVYINDGHYLPSDSSGDRIDWYGRGTSLNPIWIAGNPRNNPVIQDYVHIGINGNASYIFLDNLRFNGHESRIDIRATTANTDIDHIVIRNCYMQGSGTNLDRTAIGATNTLGGNVSYIIVFNCTIFHYGNWSNKISDDEDQAGFSAGESTRYVWILNNSIYQVGGDSVIGCHTCDDASSPEYYFIGGNNLYNNDENSIDLKGTKKVIISGNNLYGPFDEDEAAIVLHYGSHSLPVREAYVLFNNIHNASAGIACTYCKDVSIIGNTIYNLRKRDESYPPTHDKAGTAIRFRGTSGINRIVHNTIYGFDGTGILVSDGAKNFEIYGNIIDGRNDTADSYSLYIASGTNTTIDYSLLSNPKIRWYGQNYNALNSFISSTSECMHCKDDNPEFVKPPNDLTLQQNSPCIDAEQDPKGIEAYEDFHENYGINIKKDFLGNPRPQGSGWDIGAYEYVPPRECQPGDSFIRLNSTYIKACSCNQSDVQAATDAANDGDTVMVPEGECVWNARVNINKSIRLFGSGIDKTIIINNIPSSVVGDYTIYYHPQRPLNSSFELKGFTLDANNSGGCISIVCRDQTNPCRNFRIHDVKLKNAGSNGYSSSGLAIRTKGNSFGLIDHVQFVDNLQDIKVYGNDDNSWDIYPGIDNAGTSNYLYIENCASRGVKNMILSSGEGARWVYRFNWANTSKSFDAHGDTRNRGVVAHEAYENVLTNNYDPVVGYGSGFDYRGGTGIIFNNNITCGTSGVRCKIQVREEHDHCTDPKGLCDGSQCGDEVNNGYIWNNRNSRDNNIIAVWESDEYNCISENVNWWDDAGHMPGGETPSDFRYGLSGNRSSNCKNNDTYWETDTRSLYRCIGDNNWVLVYKPYIYPHPLTLAPFGTEICGEGQITEQCWCEGMRTSGQCLHGYYSECIHQTDTDCDGRIILQELLAFIERWKRNQATLMELMEAIRMWKSE